MPTFDHYSGTSDPLLHLRQFQDKMAVYAHYDLLLFGCSLPALREPLIIDFTHSQRTPFEALKM